VPPSRKESNLIVRTLHDIEGTDRDVGTQTWRSLRLVLADDQVGFSLHETVLYAGTVTSMWYRDHVEAVFCVSGRGELEDLDNETTHPLEPGTMYLLDGHEHHRVHAHTDVRTVCVFNPPCTGREVHDAEGAYPLITVEQRGGDTG
jgi:L-ectoine synthase